jgi:hypothetical protein
MAILWTTAPASPRSAKQAGSPIPTHPQRAASGLLQASGASSSASQKPRRTSIAVLNPRSGVVKTACRVMK